MMMMMIRASFMMILKKIMNGPQASEEVCLALKSGECSVLQRKELDGADGLGTVTLRVMMMMITMMILVMMVMILS